MTKEELKKNYVAICGPFPEPLDKYPDEKLALGKAIALFKSRGTPIFLKREKIEGGRKTELMLWRSREGYIVGDEGKKGDVKRTSLGHKQTASMPVVRQ